MKMMGGSLILLLVALLWSGSESLARREIRTAEQKQQLRQIQRVLVEVLALTDRGQVDSTPLRDVVVRRLAEVGYTALTDPAQPHDATLKVKCEQRKVWEGTTPLGGDADLPDLPLRTWKGPACQLTYLLPDRPSRWRREVRTAFDDAIKAAAAAQAPDPGAFALARLKERLEEYDFPVILTQEWEQEERLLALLRKAGESPKRNVNIIRALGELFSAAAGPDLRALLHDPNPEIAAAAAIALGNIGHQDSVAALIEALQTGSPPLKLAAAKALGKVGALHGDVTIIPPLLDTLNTDDLALKTEVVWALGQLPDRRAYEPLLALQRSLRDVRTSDRSSPEGKLWDALSYTLKQIDTFDQLN
jgi:hypothetical protein